MTERDEMDEMVEASGNFATALVEDLEEELPEELDFGMVMFSLFVDAIHVLVQYGWTKEDLINQVHVHEAIETTEGMIQ